MKKKIFIIAAFVGLVLTSCNVNSIAELDEKIQPDEIGIRSLSAQTKSAIDGTAFPLGYDMLISAYRNLGSYAGGDAAANYFEGIHFAYNAGASDLSSNPPVYKWKSTQGAKYWPLDGTLDFLCVASAGYNTAANGIAPSCVWGDASGNVAKKVVLTVPDNSNKFDDLLFGAANGEAPTVAGSGVQFKHAMTSVVFTAHCNVAYSATDNAGITIDGITIDGAKYSGTLTIVNPEAAGSTTEASLAATWSDLGSAVAHLPARVWNAANLGTNASETALSGLNLTATSKAIGSYPFGEAYVIMPEQATVPFTITYTIHNGFDGSYSAADYAAAVEAGTGADYLAAHAQNNQVQYQYTPVAGTWLQGNKYIYSRLKAAPTLRPRW